MSDLTSFFGQQAFDGRGVEAQADAAFIPAGKYPVIITKAETKANKGNTGHLIALEMQILDGPLRGQSIRDWINIDNPSSQCVEIGMRCLEALRQAIGVAALADTNQLLQQTVIAHVKVKDNQNSVRTYSSAAAVAPAPAPATGPLYPPAVTVAAGPAQTLAPQVGNCGEATPPPWATR